MKSRKLLSFGVFVGNCETIQISIAHCTDYTMDMDDRNVLQLPMLFSEKDYGSNLLFM